MDLSQFTQAFFVEAVELLAEMEQLLLELDVASPDAEQLNAIFRAAHSIKGGAATFGFTALTDTTHLLETLLDRARHGQLSLSAPMIDAFLETKDALQEQLTAYQAGKEPEPERVAHICAVLQQLALENGAAEGAPAHTPAPAAAPVAAKPAPAEPMPAGALRVRDSSLPRLPSSSASRSHSLSDRREKRMRSAPCGTGSAGTARAAATGAGAGAGAASAAPFSNASCCSTAQICATLSGSGSLPAW